MDLNEIREKLDRRQSSTLFDALRGADDEDQRLEIAHVLGWLDDPRMVVPLGQLMSDRSQSNEVRLAASSVLRDMTNSPDPDHGDLELLWNSGDPVLQRHALGFMTWRNEAMLDGVLIDPRHPLYPDLISELRIAFPFPRFAEVLVDALSDSRADIRYRAAESLVCNHPAIALDPLIAALGDPDHDVQLQVIETLQYFSSRKARAALLEYVKHETLAQSEVGEEAETEVSIDPLPTAESTGRPDWLRSAGAFRKRFGNPDACWASLTRQLEEMNWQDVSRFARGEIADFLISCADVAVRRHAPAALASWNDARLRGLLEDRYFAVAKAAGYAVRECSPTAELADQVWIALKSASGLHAVELLESFIVLSGADGWQARCRSIALDPYWEESVRDVAIGALFDDFDETGTGVEGLVQIADLVLKTPPVSSWALHGTIVRRRGKTKVIKLPDLSHLQRVDHLPLETAIAGIVNA